MAKGSVKTVHLVDAMSSTGFSKVTISEFENHELIINSEDVLHIGFNKYSSKFSKHFNKFMFDALLAKLERSRGFDDISLEEIEEISTLAEHLPTVQMNVFLSYVMLIYSKRSILEEIEEIHNFRKSGFITSNIQAYYNLKDFDLQIETVYFAAFTSMQKYIKRVKKEDVRTYWKCFYHFMAENGYSVKENELVSKFDFGDEFPENEISVKWLKNLLIKSRTRKVRI